MLNCCFGNLDVVSFCMKDIGLPWTRRRSVRPDQKHNERCSRGRSPVCSRRYLSSYHSCRSPDRLRRVKTRLSQYSNILRNLLALQPVRSYFLRMKTACLRNPWFNPPASKAGHLRPTFRIVLVLTRSSRKKLTKINNCNVGSFSRIGQEKAILPQELFIQLYEYLISNWLCTVNNILDTRPI